MDAVASRGFSSAPCQTSVTRGWRQDGPDRGVFPQHAAQAAARHDQQDQVEQEGQGGRDLGALVGDARQGMYAGL